LSGIFEVKLGTPISLLFQYKSKIRWLFSYKRQL
jgi:hypothetical protein